MIIVPNRIKLPDYVLSGVGVSSTRNYLIKYKLFHNFRETLVNLHRLEVPYAFRTRTSRYAYYGYNSKFEYGQMHHDTKLTKEFLDQFFKEQGELYCQMQLLKVIL